MSILRKSFFKAFFSFIILIGASAFLTSLKASSSMDTPRVSSVKLKSFCLPHKPKLDKIWKDFLNKSYTSSDEMLSAYRNAQNSGEAIYGAKAPFLPTFDLNFSTSMADLYSFSQSTTADSTKESGQGLASKSQGGGGTSGHSMTLSTKINIFNWGRDLSNYRSTVYGIVSAWAGFLSQEQDFLQARIMEIMDYVTALSKQSAYRTLIQDYKAINQQLESKLNKLQKEKDDLDQKIKEDAKSHPHHQTEQPSHQDAKATGNEEGHDPKAPSAAEVPLPAPASALVPGPVADPSQPPVTNEPSVANPHDPNAQNDPNAHPQTDPVSPEEEKENEEQKKLSGEIDEVKADLDSLKKAMDAAEQEHTNIKNSIDQASEPLKERYKLKVLPQTLFLPAFHMNLPKTLEELERLVEKHNPDIINDQFNIYSTFESNKQNDYNYLPNGIDLNASMSHSMSRSVGGSSWSEGSQPTPNNAVSSWSNSKNIGGISLSFSVPLDVTGQQQSARRSAQRNLENARASHAKTRSDKMTDVRKKWKALQTSFKSTDDALKALQESDKKLKEAKKAGVFADIINALEDRFSKQEALDSAEEDRVNHSLEIIELVGSLNGRFLGLDHNQYAEDGVYKG